MIDYLYYERDYFLNYEQAILFLHIWNRRTGHRDNSNGDLIWRCAGNVVRRVPSLFISGIDKNGWYYSRSEILDALRGRTA